MNNTDDTMYAIEAVWADGQRTWLAIPPDWEEEDGRVLAGMSLDVLTKGLASLSRRAQFPDGLIGFEAVKYSKREVVGDVQIDEIKEERLKNHA